MKDDRHIHNLMTRIPWIVVGAVVLTVLVIIIEAYLSKANG